MNIQKFPHTRKTNKKFVDILQFSLLSVFSKPINLGIVDKLITEFENRVFSTKKAGRKFMDDYLKEVCNGLFCSIS